LYLRISEVGLRAKQNLGTGRDGSACREFGEWKGKAFPTAWHIVPKAEPLIG
jgi:hypothetical protein